LPAFIKERYGLPLTDEDREKAEKAAESRARTFDNRRETWERRRDWGRWWSESSSKPQKHPQSVRSLKGESVVEKAQEVADDGDVQGDEDDE
jgi:hypothetical protein